MGKKDGSPYDLDSQMRLYLRVCAVAFAVFLVLSALMAFGWSRISPEEQNEISTMVEKAIKLKQDSNSNGGNNPNDQGDEGGDKITESHDVVPFETGAEDRPPIDNNCVLTGECG